MDWTAKEVKLLKNLLESGKTLREVATLLGRPYNSVEHKSRELVISRPEPPEVTLLSAPPSDIREALVSGKKLKPEEKQALLDVVYPDIAQGLKTNIFPKNAPKFVKGLREEEAVLILSDMHTGMKNEIYDPRTQRKIVTYDEAIRQEEMRDLRNSIFEIHDILSKAYNLKKLHILILGDMVTNDRIFDGQTFEIDRPCGVQLWDTARDLTNFINEMRTKFADIHIIGVVGNHGRSQAHYSEEPVENNFEYTMYRVIQDAFKGDPHIKMEVPNTRFYSTQILGHTIYMSHGDSFRGFSRGAVDKAARDLLATLVPDLPAGFDLYCVGHMHSSEKMDINEKSTILVNGSWIPRDQFGFKAFRRYSKPQQWFFGVSKGRPITWAYALDLKGQKVDF